MKKNMKKAAALTLSAVMAAGLLTGCGSSGNTASTGGSQSTGSTGTGTTTTDGIDLSEHVDLTMYLLGDRSADFDEVYGEINKILEDKLNCSINVEFLSWGEHDTKYSLLFSGGEDFDLIFTASSWGHYEQTVALGGFYELTEDFLQTYARKSGKQFPSICMEPGKD